LANQFTCFVIGEDSLLIRCCEILLQKNHLLYGIVTSNQAIVSWANDNNIPAYELNDKLTRHLEEQPYDYLFSITNLKILKDEIVNSPKKSAINFHDGPLPKYAGINATSWALMNQEKTYGITWHEMTSEVDKGDILKQILFEISDNENALSLNAKCFEAASAAFEELVDELSHETVKPTKQNFDERTYFGKFKRPENAALIDWDNSADKIFAFVNALDFGRYTNPLGMPKVKVNDRYFILSQLEITDINSEESPGTVTSINEESIWVSTKTTNVKFDKALSIGGDKLSIAKLIELFSLRVGFRFNKIDEELSKGISEYNSAITKKEDFWVKELSQLEFIDVQYAKQNTNSDSVPNYTEVKLEIPKSIYKSYNDKNENLSEMLASAFGIFMGRHGRKTRYSIGYSNSELIEKSSSAGLLFAEFVPVRLEFNPGDEFKSTITNLAARFKKAAKAKTYIRDMLARHPELNNLTEQNGQPIYPVSVVVVNNSNENRVQQHSLVTLKITTDGKSVSLIYDSFSISEDDIKMLKGQFLCFLEETVNNPATEIGKISMLSTKERKILLEDWNNTQTDYPTSKCMHELFEEQVSKTPDSVAVVCRGKSLSYKDLNNRTNQLARKLQNLGVGPEILVGISLHRSIDMVVAIMGTLKAGGAYVPLDPEFPEERISYMIQDSKCPVIITEEKIRNEINAPNSKVISIDGDWNEISKEETSDLKGGVSSDNLSYVIYTSGSTGKPKGVMVQHRNVVNFFKGMDENIKFDPPGTWLAVTSLSFDISVLELFWTLSHGFKLVLYAEEDWKSDQIKTVSKKKTKRIDFSLFYFSSYEGENPDDKYRLLIEGAKFADQNRFKAVWTPERHFHDFGGLYPNPAITGAGIATITEHVKIMSGSCVSPLHSPIRIAEEWSVVDNLSKGRVGMSFAAGWQPNDFAIKPENYDRRKDIMFEQIETVRKLWRGETVNFEGPNGNMVEVKTMPRPIQKDLPIWITAANNPETFRMAGERGFYLLTHLLGQTVEDLAEKLALYREAWKQGGHNGDGYISLMLHTFVGENLDEVRETVREPMKHYLGSAVSLVKLASWYFPTYDKLDNEFDEAVSKLSEEDMDAILNHAFERYFETSALLGTPETCLEMVEKLKAVGVDDVACLIDFGVDSEKALDHLQYLNAVKTLANVGVRETEPVNGSEDYSIPELIKQHNVTHMQCTPSMAKMLLLNEDSKAAFKKLNFLMIGGEAFPVSLANQLGEIVDGEILNMYGPTETTIWSSTFKLNGELDSVPIGKPIANTEIFLLDENQQLVPIGVPGELCIGGDGVVRGYFQRPELTDERFIPHPFNNKNGNKVYRTGDLACYKKDGVIEFLGRLDHQVKIRGYRIELGEIETVLEKNSLIREAVVIAREDTPGDKKLVAYMVSATQSHPSILDLRKYLKEKLPEYMIPSAYVFMEIFPLTPNSKVDRLSLPAPEIKRLETKREFSAPRTHTEKSLAKLWSEVLNIKKISVQDNFFDLGGHSLSAIQITSQMQKKLNVNIPLQTFFDYPTIAGLSNKVEAELFKSTSGKDMEKLLNEIEGVQASVKKTK